MEIMKIIKFYKVTMCDFCSGAGKLNGIPCIVCEGEGFFE